MTGDGPATGRRPVIVAMLAGIGAWAARGAAAPAAAADGDPVRLGRRNVASSTTRIVDTTASSTAIRARASGPGAIGLQGVSVEGTGVHGLSRDANGVQGESVFGVGVSGHSIEPGSTAVSGDSTSGVGVQGGSHGGVGVQGNSQFSVAVRGGNVSETDPAIQGWAQNGQTGVMGRARPSTSSTRSPVHSMWVCSGSLTSREAAACWRAVATAGRSRRADGCGSARPGWRRSRQERRRSP